MYLHDTLEPCRWLIAPRDDSVSHCSHSRIDSIDLEAYPMAMSGAVGLVAITSLQWTKTSVHGGLVILLLSMLYITIWRPYKLRAFYWQQDVGGPGYRPLVGNWIDIWSLQRKLARIKRQPAYPADVVVRNMPHLSHWSKLYGPVFTYMQGTKLNLCLLDTKIIQEVLVNKADCYRRSPGVRRWLNMQSAIRQNLESSDRAGFMGHSDPRCWSMLRRILGPRTDQGSVQGNLQKIINHCNGLVYRWDTLLDEASMGDGTVEVDAMHDIAKISTHIVLNNLIGSTLATNDYKMIDSILDTKKHELETATATCLCNHFGGSRSSKDGWLDQLLAETAKSRFRTLQGEDPRDLLDCMVASSCRQVPDEDVRQIVADCKMMVAAQESTTFLINQTLVLLARHREWQDQARAEVIDIRPLMSAFEEEGEGRWMVYPNLAKLKVLNMILNESLRLSPPIISIKKQCQKRHRLGKYKVLPGTYVQIPIVLLHHSQDLWGDDSLSFRPDRFENGCRSPFALLPFSAGPSVCLGFSFALQEAKIMLVTLLSNFSFRLSPDPHSYSENAMRNPLFRIRRLKVEDFAQASKARLPRWRSSNL